MNKTKMMTLNAGVPGQHSAPVTGVLCGKSAPLSGVLCGKSARRVVNALIGGRCKVLSRIFGTDISRMAVLQFLAACPLIVVGMVSISDGVQEYLWGGVLLLAGTLLSLRLVSEMRPMLGEE